MTRLVLKTSLILLCLIGTYSLSARHIIGGVITYECLGNDEYEFTLKVYRDCNCQNCAFFDPEAPIGIYNCGTDIPCYGLDQSSTYEMIFPSYDSITYVDIPEYPCLIPPDVCVQEASYTFTVTLPQSTESYHLSYQRCCRNETINNILVPDETGATFTIEITPEAQAVCNNSPVFSTFPPTVICADQPLEYDHSATDADGDQLVYKFCPPLKGGGLQFDGPDATSCYGVTPNPGCPPPYSSVYFLGPEYTVDTPMGGNPVISIDPNTGLITGTPDLIGQFVVGVCVEEYRDGVLLSTVFRDFQFNVAPCDPLVMADILEDEEIAPGEYLINSCDESTLTLTNQSFDQEFIHNWQWNFDMNGTPYHSSEWSPTITFPAQGHYEGQLILNADTECSDTATVYVNIFPAIEADFEAVYDTCAAGPVNFINTSTTGSCCLTYWSWEFGDGGYSYENDPIHNYEEPGEYPVRLFVRDTNNCEDILIEPVPYYPVPELVIVSPNADEGCEPLEVFFDNLSTPVDTTYDIFWNFGDGETAMGISPVHIYNTPGLFTIDVSITSPIGCEVVNSFSDLILVEPSPHAGFSFSPETISILDPVVSFSDESQDANTVFWTFGDGHNSFSRDPIHTYSDTGMVTVTQIVTHLSGCTDTLRQLLDITPNVSYFLPNAFTPNNDSVNDYYKGIGIIGRAENYRFSIWNRWGELVFQTSDPEEGWNGQKFNNGRPAPSGVYLVTVSFTGPRGEVHEYKGLATLIR